jgi:beta-ribofuranosylaminobenzene 5'-phosphate synthase
MAEVVVRAPSRLHFGLIDLSNATPRKYGGAGVMLDHPLTTARARTADSFRIEHTGIAAEYVEAVDRAISRFAEVGHRIRCSVSIDAKSPPHVGLGSKTSTVLATLAAINSIEGLGLSTTDLQLLSGRGGTSGVGVNGFFSGGFIVDGGHEQGGSFGPSSDGPPSRIPPVVSRCKVPAAWRFSLLLPEGKRLSGSDERAFFAANTPIPTSESLATLALVHDRLAPAFLSADIQAVRAAVTDMQATGFKRREVEAQSHQVRRLLTGLSDLPSVAAGLSSIGPLVYAIHDVSDTRALADIQRLGDSVGAHFLGDVRANEVGADISVGS